MFQFVLTGFCVIKHFQCIKSIQGHEYHFVLSGFCVNRVCVKRGSTVMVIFIPNLEQNLDKDGI